MFEGKFTINDLDSPSSEIKYLDSTDIVTQGYIPESHLQKNIIYRGTMKQFKNLNDPTVEASDGFIMCFAGIEFSYDGKYRLSHVVPLERNIRVYKNKVREYIPNIKQISILRTNSPYKLFFDNPNHLQEYKNYSTNTSLGLSDLYIPIKVIEFTLPEDWNNFTVTYGDGYICVWDPINKLALQVFKIQDLANL